MKSQLTVSAALAGATLTLWGCAPKGPTGPEKAAAYHAEQARREEAVAHPTPAPAEETSLQFPMCVETKPPAFPPETAGATFRAILYFRITDAGKTKEHCYLAIDGSLKWEEKALGQVESWTYPVEHAGQPRERVITYRLK